MAEEGYPEADEAREALAAAEIIAATLGNASRDFPKNLLRIASTLPLTSADAAKRGACRAIKAILIKVGTTGAVAGKRRVRSVANRAAAVARPASVSRAAAGHRPGQCTARRSWVGGGL